MEVHLVEYLTIQWSLAIRTQYRRIVVVRVGPVDDGSNLVRGRCSVPIDRFGLVHVWSVLDDLVDAAGRLEIVGLVSGSGLLGRILIGHSIVEDAHKLGGSWTAIELQVGLHELLDYALALLGGESSIAADLPGDDFRVAGRELLLGNDDIPYG